MSLCPEAGFRASLDDGDFWNYVLLGIRPGDPSPEPDWVDDDEPSITKPPCPECGSIVACGYDEQGRAMVHATDRADADVPPWEVA